MANSADPDQLASSEANWSGSTLFAKAGYSQDTAGPGLIKFHYQCKGNFWISHENNEFIKNLPRCSYILPQTWYSKYRIYAKYLTP